MMYAERLLLICMGLGCITLSRAENERPIIGVLAQKNSGWFGKGDTFIRSSYFDFVAQAGARAVPIRVKESDEYYERMFKSINGLLLPGGGVNVTSSYYAEAAEKLFNLAMQANDGGDYFPIWGTCLGLEQLAILVGGDDVLSHVQAWNVDLPLTFIGNYKDTRMYSYLSEDAYDYVRRSNVTQNMHHFGLLTRTFNNNNKLKSFFNVLTTNTDPNGLQFISSMEGKKYPFYAVQYHPEKSLYDWDVTVRVNHHVYSVIFSQNLADFFVQEARKSNHDFSTIKEASEALIANYIPVYMGEPSFSEVYFFNFDGRETRNSDIKPSGQFSGYTINVEHTEVRKVGLFYSNSLTLILVVVVLIVMVITTKYMASLATFHARMHKYHALAQQDAQTSDDVSDAAAAEASKKSIPNYAV